MVKQFIFNLIFVLVSFPCFAATYYIAPTGNDSTGNGSTTTPWRTFTTADSHMSSGDTLIYKNGTYNYAGSNISDPVSGTAGAYTVIQAETAGSVTIIATGTDQNLYPIDISGNSSYQPQYIRINGFVLRNTVGCMSIFGYSNTSRANHIEIRNCTGRTTAGGDDAVAGIGVYSEDCLVEDCAFWGCCRTIVLTYGMYPEGTRNTERITWRRVVGRFDAYNPGSAGGQNVFTFYGAQDSIYENCIAIDANSAPDPFGAFRNRSNSEEGNRFLGCIALNISNFFAYNLNGASASSRTSAVNCVGAGSSNPYYMVYSDNNPYIDYINCTFNGYSGIALRGVGGYTTATNILFHDGGSGVIGITPSYCHFDNAGAIQGTNASSGDSGLLYLTRIENSSVCKGSGESGADKGANIVNRYVAGVLTATALWPFPNEERYRTEMRESYSLPSGASPSTNDVTRGFCADGETLTHYIMNYLGNGDPYSGLQITTTSLPNGTVGTAYSQSISASGGTSPYTYNITAGSLPTSLSMSSAGAITGTPTVANTFNFTVTVTDDVLDTDNQALSIIINTEEPPAGNVTMSLSGKFNISGKVDLQ